MSYSRDRDRESRVSGRIDPTGEIWRADHGEVNGRSGELSYPINPTERLGEC